MSDTDREVLGRAFHDYEAAVKAARALWTGAQEGTLREAATDFLIHVRELRRTGNVPASSPQPHAVTAAAPAAHRSPYAPSEKQLVFYRRLVQSPVFTEEERRRALEWLTANATRQTIKDQIDWLKQQVETRRSLNGGR
jgi:hypothetical protein